MGDNAPKSAFEIAMEKLKEQDRRSGDEAPASLTKAQKKAIADTRSKAQARLAEIEIFFKSNREGTAGDPEALQKLEEEYARERRRIEEEKESKIAKVRRGKAAE